VGWAAGIERILLAAADGDEEPEADGPVYVAVATPEAARRAFALARTLRPALDARVELEQAGRSLKGQLKHADRLGARAVVIVGDAIEVKDMSSGEQRTARDEHELLRLLAS
jgi:histidyl-tRNA synthetase